MSERLIPIWVKPNVPLWIGQSLLSQPDIWHSLRGKAVCIVSSPNIAQFYLPTLTQTLSDVAVKKVDHFFLPEGESHKNIESVSKLWDFLATHHYYRDDVLIALGGGVIGDLTGLAASCYMRGMAFIQCPTTLMAQVDAAIGGKTAINHPIAKNLIGTYYTPTQIVCSLDTLRSLPMREYASGLSEVIKHALLLEKAFFYWLIEHASLILEKEPTVLETFIQKSCETKIKFVTMDEKEQRGIRQSLNLGHTVAHALESLLGYDKLLHGEAVAIGLCVATQLSCQVNKLDRRVLDELIKLLEFWQLPVSIPKGLTVDAIFSKIKHDKKHRNHRLQWVLLNQLGQAHLMELDEAQIKNALVDFGAKQL